MIILPKNIHTHEDNKVFYKINDLLALWTKPRTCPQNTNTTNEAL